MQFLNANKCLSCKHIQPSYTVVLHSNQIFFSFYLPISTTNRFPCGSAGKESTCNVETWVQSLGWKDSPGEGKGYPLQYSGLENSMDCIVHGVTESQTQLSNFHFTSPPISTRGIMVRGDLWCGSKKGESVGKTGLSLLGPERRNLFFLFYVGYQNIFFPKNNMINNFECR